MVLASGVVAAPLLQSTVLYRVLPGGMTPDLALALTLVAGLTLGPLEGALWGLATGTFMGALCGPAHGSLGVVYTLTGGLAGAAAARLAFLPVLSGSLSRLLIIAVLTSVHLGLQAGVVALFHLGWGRAPTATPGGMLAVRWILIQTLLTGMGLWMCRGRLVSGRASGRGTIHGNSRVLSPTHGGGRENDPD